MEDIPIHFMHNGQAFSGHFSRVKGSGSNDIWHLRSDSKFYMGQLHLTDRHGWVFYEQLPQFADLANFFGDYLIAWYQ